jgi:hypothetical protein
MDPMTTVEAGYEESVTKADDARVEQHWREAELAVGRRLSDWFDSVYDKCDPLEAAHDVVQDVMVPMGRDGDDVRLLRAFTADYGTPALLRVIAKALETK